MITNTATLSAQLDLIMTIIYIIVLGIVISIGIATMLAYRRGLTIPKMTVREMIAYLNPAHPTLYITISGIMLGIGIGAVVGVMMGWDIAANTITKEYLSSFDYSICTNKNPIDAVRFLKP